MFGKVLFFLCYMEYHCLQIAAALTNEQDDRGEMADAGAGTEDYEDWRY